MSTRKPTTIAVALSVVVAGWTHGKARAQSRVDVPIILRGVNGDLSDCAGGEVFGLNPRGDGFLSVLSTPGQRPYREIDRLHNGQEVSLCGRQGAWVAIVYRAGLPLSENCNVKPSRPARRPYTGPCDYGWVHQRYVRITAG